MGDLGLLVGTVIVLAIIGVGLYLLFTKVPMDDTIKIVIKVVVILAAVYWLLSLVGIVPRFHS